MGPKALLTSLKGKSPLERIHIPILGATQSAHWAVNYSPYIWAIRHFIEVNIRKEQLSNTVTNVYCQIYLAV